MALAVSTELTPYDLASSVRDLQQLSAAYEPSRTRKVVELSGPFADSPHLALAFLARHDPTAIQRLRRESTEHMSQIGSEKIIY